MSLTKARELRRHMTDAESQLWQRLRYRQIDVYKFRRQVPLGRYIVDFVCLEARLAVELDGGQHQMQAAYDHDRDTWLRQEGFRVLRFWNNEVFANMDGVLSRIREELQQVTGAPPHPNPPPPGGRGSTPRHTDSPPPEGRGSTPRHTDSHPPGGGDQRRIIPTFPRQREGIHTENYEW